MKRTAVGPRPTKACGELGERVSNWQEANPGKHCTFAICLLKPGGNLHYLDEMRSVRATSMSPLSSHSSRLYIQTAGQCEQHIEIITRKKS
ncbi:hypothetical protein N7457_003323 [Penicillium paradoxum]|uniref:uncharacterized protein n=1 Tax=Penicillium paradoxum TaxID=176176 RepID=UPI00254928DE|nr:uncharacterized protein N7457_003323 [Penicillium paradoxum]KAJ5788333.1 hypothetical protein N7457_003323 [Penicillium paradoxum]